MENIKTIRFRVIRPINEANSLSEQIKGYMRRGMRGAVGVRVLMTETWDLHGAEVVIGHKAEKSEEREIQFVGRCKPHGRIFRYSNGL
jgi:hypothetical protein